MTDNIKNTKNEMEDQELNDLLDSALKDFDKISVSNNENGNATTISDIQEQTDQCETTETAENLWTEDFMKQTTDQFEKNLQNLLQNGGDSEVGAALQRLGLTSSNDVTAGDDFRSTVSQVLNDLSRASEHLENDADLAAMFGQTSLDDDTGGILPIMQGMMQQLLSKELLYLPLKELSDKYPVWLEEHKETLSPSDLQRYTKQSEVVQKVCSEFEKEKEDDTEDVKKLRFESILSLMHEMQSYGQAPEDLVGESTLFQFDSEENLPLPPGELQQNCCVM